MSSETLTLFEAGETERVPPGYKQTEVGVIPEDWFVCSLVSICTPDGLVRGPFGGALKKNTFVRGGAYKVYEQKNAIHRSAELGTYFIDESMFRELVRFEVRPGDFIVSCSGTIGRIFQIPEQANVGIINQALLKIKIDDRKVSDRFFFHVFASDQFQERIMDNTHGGAMPNLVGMDTFKNTKLSMPSLPAQRAIAAALSDVDAMISSLDRLISKKRGVKIAAMQQLLTGNRRLPGFSAEWETRRLEDVADVDCDNLSANTDPTYQFKYISLEDVDNGTLRGFSHQRFATAPSRARRSVREGDVLISTVRPNLKSHLLFSGLGDGWVCSTGFSLVRCKERLAHPGFVYQHLFHGVFPKQIEALIAGSNYPAISAKDVRAFRVLVPDIEEQTAIATVLSDMDAEIEALQARREKTRRIKQGMMQELLTGRTRLVPEDA